MMLRVVFSEQETVLNFGINEVMKLLFLQHSVSS